MAHQEKKITQLWLTGAHGPVSSLGHLVRCVTRWVQRAFRGKGLRHNPETTGPEGRSPLSNRHLPVVPGSPRQRHCLRRQSTPCHLRLVTQGHTSDGVGVREEGTGNLSPGAQEEGTVLGICCHPALRFSTSLLVGLNPQICQMELHQPACLPCKVPLRS